MKKFPEARSASHSDPLVRHCDHARCRRAGRCRAAGRHGDCLAIAPLRRSLMNRLMAELERQIG